MLKIVQAPQEVLSKKATPIHKIDKSVTKLIEEMTEALENAKDPEGVGLAAPQVGKSVQLFIVKEALNSPIAVFINPTINEFIDNPKKQEEEEKQEKEKNEDGVQLEGCLSLKDIWGVVKRHDAVVLSYQDEKGLQHEKKFEGFIATIIQHECDHLQGILFPKRVLEQSNKLYKSSKDKKGENVFEEIEI